MPPFVAAKERVVIKVEGKRGTKMMTVMKQKRKGTKKKENTYLCDNPYQTSRWSTAIGRASWW